MDVVRIFHKLARVCGKCGLALVVAGACASRAGESPSFVEGEALVRFRRGETLETTRSSAAAHDSVVARKYVWLSAHEGRPIVHLRARHKTTAQFLDELRRDPRVELAEPNYIRPLLGTTVIPNDVEFTNLWAMRNTGQTVNGDVGISNADIRAPQAWALLPPSMPNVVVAVLDTGIDGGHPDLAGSLWINAGENPTNGVDDDGNGYIDDYYGYDFAGDQPDPDDSGYHGSHVAGTIAATGQNGIGVIGVAWPAQLMSLRVSSNGTSINAAAEIEGIQYAAMMRTQGVNIVAINASFGDTNYSTFEHDAIQQAADAGIVFCAAAGNSAANDDVTPLYPACYAISNIIAVANSDQNDWLWGTSSYGTSSVALVAPGVNILSIQPLSLASRSTSVSTGGILVAGEPFKYGGLTTGLTATLYYCALGYPGDFPGGVTGNIALIQRGAIDYNAKVANAMSAGAAAVVLYNNQAGTFGSVSLHFPTNWIPVVGISQANGQTLVAAGNVTATVVNAATPASLYAFRRGTSMASPHVAGAIAVAALCFPQENMMARIGRVLSNVTPLSYLATKVRTSGRLNLARMLDTNTNGLPDWWETRYFGALTNSSSGDEDHDHMSNWAEWQAGTDPTNGRSFLAVDISAAGPGSVDVRWPSVTGHSYAIETSSNLLQGFTPVLTHISATPPTNTAPVATNSPGFFRLVVE